MNDRAQVAATMLAAMLSNPDLLGAAIEQAEAKGLRPEQILAVRAIAQADTLLAILSPVQAPSVGLVLP